jgi:hypothetical protein
MARLGSDEWARGQDAGHGQEWVEERGKGEVGAGGGVVGGVDGGEAGCGWCWCWICGWGVASCCGWGGSRGRAGKLHVMFMLAEHMQQTASDRLYKYDSSETRNHGRAGSSACQVSPVLGNVTHDFMAQWQQRVNAVSMGTRGGHPSGVSFGLPIPLPTIRSARQCFGLRTVTAAVHVEERWSGDRIAEKGCSVLQVIAGFPFSRRTVRPISAQRRLTSVDAPERRCKAAASK